MEDSEIWTIFIKYECVKLSCQKKGDTAKNITIESCGIIINTTGKCLALIPKEVFSARSNLNN